MVDRLRKARSRVLIKEQKTSAPPAPLASPQAIAPVVPLQPSDYVKPLVDNKKQALGGESTVISRSVPNDTMVTKESDARTIVTKEPDIRTMMTKDADTETMVTREPDARMAPRGNDTINWLQSESPANRGVIPLTSMTPSTFNEVLSSSSGRHSRLSSRVPEPQPSNPSRCMHAVLSCFLARLPSTPSRSSSISLPKPPPPPPTPRSTLVACFFL